MEVAAQRTGHLGGGSFGASRFDQPAGGFQHQYETPGWQRAQQHWERQVNGLKGGPASKMPPPRRKAPGMIDGDLVASSAVDTTNFKVGDKVVHDKFGAGVVAAIDGNKLTVDFEEAGRKRVVESFVAPA